MTGVPPLTPLADIPISPVIAALPKADLHVHQEERPRLDRIIARRAGRSPYDWRRSLRRIMAETPPGMARLSAIFALDNDLALADQPGTAPEEIVAKIADVLEEGAADGALLVEVRFGAAADALARPDFMALFREAERRVQSRYPRLHAEAIGYLGFGPGAVRRETSERWLAICLRAARDGLAGLDFRVDPYDTDADPALWAVAYRYAERAVDAGLGITVHAGEFSTANVAAALRVPGLTRLGHAAYAAAEPRLLAALAASGVAVECCLSCNVVAGAVPSFAAHPIRRFVDAGIPVTLNTDDPVRVCTTIGREYALANALGLSPADLLAFTRTAIEASFTTAERKAALRREVRGWAAPHPLS